MSAVAVNTRLVETETSPLQPLVTSRVGREHCSPRWHSSSPLVFVNSSIGFVAVVTLFNTMLTGKSTD